MSNGLVHATLYLPNPEKGYYRGSRFDWSGIFGGLEHGGHSYVGQWLPRHDPRIHDAVGGPAEAFLPIGFDSAAPGEGFLVIGVGVLRKPDSQPYHFSHPYEIINGGRWTTIPADDEVRFIQELDDGAGHAWSYAKTVRLVPGESIVRIEHRLQNTGAHPLVTRVLNHNFWMLDRQPTGPALSACFAFDVKTENPVRGFGELAQVEGSRITYRRDLEPGEIVAADLAGFSASPSQNDVRLENSATGAGIRITGDRPMSRLYYWSVPNTACPEPYIDLDVPPGGEFDWEIVCELYEV